MGCRKGLEVDPSLCVFREIWATAGRRFEKVAVNQKSDKGRDIRELAADLKCWLQESRFGWPVVDLREIAKMPIKCTVTHQSDHLATTWLR